MASTIPGIPPESGEADLANGTITLSLDAAVYPLEAVYGASYVFIDRCFVLVDQPAPDRFRVSLSTKKLGATEDALRDLVGEFANELLSCAWRHRITQENRALIEAVTMQSIGGAMGPATLDDLASFDFTSEPFEDPLGIAMSWEEKYKKGKDEKKDEKQGEAGQADAAAKADEPSGAAEAGAGEVKSA